MRKILFFFATSYLLLARPILAHTGGLPTYFKINDQYAIPTSLQAAAITKPAFPIPQDVAPEDYLTNQSITFNVDTDMLLQVLPTEIINHTKFYLDFGDGSKEQEGTRISHSYLRIGSYIVTVRMELYDDKGTLLTKYIDPYLLNIVPTKGFKKFPQAVISVNGQTISDSQYGRADVDFHSAVVFDARQSTAGSTIREYRWNFGDGTSSDKSKVEHTLKSEFSDTVVLRIKDKNSFLSYAFLNLKNTKYKEYETPVTQKKTELPPLPIMVIVSLVIILLIVTVLMILSMRRR